MLLPGYVEAVLQVIKQHQPDLIELGYKRFTDSGALDDAKPRYLHRSSGWLTKDKAVTDAFKVNQWFPWLRVYRKKMLSDFQFPAGIAFCEDVMAMPALYQAAERLYHLRLPLYGYREHQASASFNVKAEHQQQLQHFFTQLQQQQVNIVYARASDSKSLDTVSSNINTNGLNTTTLHCTNGQQLSADRVIMATGTAAPEWTRASQLACDQDGFIQVGATHQSTSHPNVFAVGDICQRVDQPVAHSGVHAVHAGAVLADNLLAYLAGTALRPYQPKARSLYLLSCGTPYAIACWGRYHLEGAWVWRLKQQIDHRFVRRYQF
mgnify:CR=1 FL=1